ncbi:MAG: acyloxyacyl hydrolase [Bacteroidales bacterium]|nr:acyloxyacyl hydrolase [Bacteroidales bacterium]
MNPTMLKNNPYNDVIGSWLNVYFNFNLDTYWRLSERMDISFGLDITHFSNGRFRTPNKGMNLMGVNLGVAYNFSPMNIYRKHSDEENIYPIRAPFIREPLPELDKYSEINFFGTIGTSTTSGDPDVNEAGPRYFNSSWGIDFARRFWWRGKYVIGTDIFYDGSLVEGYGKPYSEVSVIEKMSFGIHAGHDMMFERITLITQLGWYVYKKSSQRGSYYIRAGGKIAINEKWSAHVALKTMNGGIADWIEWGMVYSIRLKKEKG